MPPEAALWAAAVMVLTGVGLGGLLTVYASVRAEWRFPRALSAAADGLVVLAATVPVGVGLLIATWGTVRLWAVAGLVLGLVVWSSLGAPAAAAAARWAARCLRQLGRWAIRPLSAWRCARPPGRLPKSPARN